MFVLILNQYAVESFVLGVYSSREQAEHFKRVFGVKYSGDLDKDVTIEEYRLNDEPRTTY